MKTNDVHGRSDNVKTVTSLKNSGYAGKLYIIIDDLDATRDDYVKKFGDKVIVFDKAKYAKLIDQGDNFNNLRTTTHARNACFDIAVDLGLENFLVLDDDMTSFRFRFTEKLEYTNAFKIKNLQPVIDAALGFLNNSPVACVAFAQGGEFIGGDGNRYAQQVYPIRKAMNSFFCSTKKPFKFISRLNEDVNTYVTLGSRGQVFLTSSQCTFEQSPTQKSKGGMSEAYADSGTYVKSFYTVMYQPSSVKVSLLVSRIHHEISEKHTYPKILRESVKKK